MPKGLIPLMLSPSSTEGSSSRSRSSISISSRTSLKIPIVSPATPAHKRNASDITPMTRMSRPPIRAVKRQSQQAPASLPVLPYTPAEWKKAIAEIKRYHVTRRHRACSARCSEILTNTKDISKVEPAYLIYLNFYAATSLEMCARSLQPASSYRTSLLQQARSHYEKASLLIQTAENAVRSRSRSSSSASSSAPSLHSPSGSVSSRAWTPESGLMTPTRPASRKSSLQQEPGSGKKEKPKKKVSFELPKDKNRWSFELPEPIVRPDSPTLGFDDEYFAVGASRQELPELPPKRWLEAETAVMAATMTSPPSMPSISEGEELSPASSPSSDGDCFGEYYFPRYDDAYQYQYQHQGRSLSLSRYCDTLSSLRRQVASHTSSLDGLLESDQQVLLSDSSSHHREQQQPQQKQQQQQQPPGSPLFPYDAPNSYFGRQRSCSDTSFASYYGPGGDGDGEEDEARVLDRRARVDRLRMNGWKRKRFDASRYEELCEQVMAELDEQ